MSANPVRMYSGVDSVRAADAYRLAIEARRDQWPYPHVFPPPNSQDVNVIRTLVTQAQGAAAVSVVTYKVDAGKRFFLRAVILGANVTMLPGDALFTVDRNSPVGITDIQFLPEHGLLNIGVQLGSTTFGPWRLQRAREFAPLDVVRIKATNVNLAEGTPNFYVCGLFGYIVPTLDVKTSR